MLLCPSLSYEVLTHVTFYLGAEVLQRIRTFICTVTLNDAAKQLAELLKSVQRAATFHHK